METYDATLAALADPTRRAVFERLRSGPLPVAEIARELPVSRPAVSQHLRVLEQAGLVHAERVGTRHVYRMERKGVAALRRYVEELWDDVLDQFKRAAENEAHGGQRS